MNRCLVTLLLGLPLLAQAQAQAPALPAPPEGLQPFAVEFHTGPNWVADKPPQEQLHFREHSANLKRLRDAGLLIVGARLDERGFVVIAATDEAAARAEVDVDPSVKAGVFRYQVAPLRVFYGGSLPAASRR